MQKHKWPDLSPYGIRLVISVLPSGQRFLVLMGGDKAPESADRLGFHKLGTGQWVRDDLRFSLGAFRREFPKLSVAELEAAEIIRQGRFRPAPTPQAPAPAMPADVALMQAKYLGLNHLNDEVWEGVDGRFVRRDGAVVFREATTPDAPAVFLRAPDRQSLALCTDGFVNEILSGKRLHMTDVARFASAIHGEAVDIADPRLRAVQDGIEAALVRRLASDAQAIDRSAFDEGLRLYEGQPVFKARTSSSVVLQQFSTPLPMAVVAQRLLGTAEELRGKTVLEPTIGNGSLVSLLPESRVIGFDLDSDRLARTAYMLNSARAARPQGEGGAEAFDVRVGDATKEAYPSADFSIVNPPFGGLQPPVVMNGLRVTRVDHQVLMKALDARAPDGRTVAIIAGDSPRKTDPGAVIGGSRYLFNWLADHYHVEGVVEMDGGMYSRQGSSYPVRMLVIGAKRDVPARGLGPTIIPDQLPVVRDYEGLWDWSNHVLTQRGVAIAGPALAEVEAPSSEAKDGKEEPAREPSVLTEQGAHDLADKYIGQLPHPLLIKFARDGNLTPVEYADIAKACKDFAAGAGRARAVNPQAEVVAREVAALSEFLEARGQRQTPPAPKPKAAIDAEENAWQAPYVPVSQVGEPSAMIPRNLVGPTRAALARVVDQHGNLDEWVAAELGWSVEEMGQKLSPEQVDAVGLAFHAADRGRGMIVADQTGLGKGRTLAAFARKAALAGQPVIFLTEKANLFSDLWRDLQAIESDGIFRPMILNSGIPIRDTVTGEILVSATAPPLVKNAVQENALVPGTNIVFATYSQFNRPGAKRDWLEAVAQGACIILDESHNAAGESNTANAVAAAVQAADAVIYSSATFAKNAQNLAAYAKAFPKEMDLANLPETIKGGGEALQEIMSGMLAEDGVLVRREHDLSTVEFRALLDVERAERNRAMCDALSPILTTMAYLGGDIQRIVADLNAENRKVIEKLPEEDRKGNRLQVSSMEFGSRLYSLNRLFVLALKNEQVQEQALECLRRGEKPVVFVENTMESLLRDIINDMRMEVGEGAESEELPANLEVNLQFRDLLMRTLERMMVITERTGYGVVDRRQVDHPATLAAFGRCAQMIAEFPDLPVSPLDQLRERLEDEGYRCEELSGRSLQVARGRVMPRPSEDRNSVISRFNSGAADAIIISGAGSTGLSLHAGQKFSDQRRRALLELQIANNVASRVQTWGRVNRKDQVVTPAIVTLNTGLPAEARLMAMQNEKLRKLSANVTSNRSNAAEDESVPDILNWVGNHVCRRMLESRPDLADRLMISIPSPQDTPPEDELYFVNKLLGRLTLLKSDEQEDLYQEITNEFRAVMEDFEAKGINPFKAKELDGQWEVIGQTLFEGAENGGKRSVFQAPVWSTMVEGERLIKPLRSTDLEQMAANGHERMLEGTGMPSDQAMWEMGRIVQQRRQPLLEAVLPKDFETVEEALAAPNPNGVKSRNELINETMTALDSIRIGGSLHVTDEEGEQKKGFITRIDLPPRGKEHLAGQYSITFAIPGDEKPRRMSMYALMKDPAFKADPLGANLKPFDAMPEGKVKVVRNLLDGNLFRATEVSQTVKLGDGKKLGTLVVWRDKEGIAHRGLLLPKNVVSIDLLPVEMKGVQAAAFLREVGDGRLYTSPSLDDRGVIMHVERGKIVLSAPGSATASVIYANKAVVEVTGDWAGDRDRMYVAVPANRAEALMEALAGTGCRFYAEGAHRPWANNWASLEAESFDDEGPQHRARSRMNP